MRRNIAILASTVFALAVMLPVAMANGNSHDKATGGVKGLLAGTERQLNFNAHDLGPMGKVRYEILTGPLSGAVFRGTVNECYEQEGNEAVFAGVIDEGTGVFADRTHFKVHVQDNQPGGSGVMPDMFRVRTTDEGPEDCDQFEALNTTRTEGNLTVH